MTRNLLSAAAPLFAILALAGGAAPSAAQGTASFFTAQLSVPADEARFAAGGVVWHCEGTSCRAAYSNARPLRVCSGLQREVGAVTGFSAGGTALTDEELARCNG